MTIGTRENGSKCVHELTTCPVCDGQGAPGAVTAVPAGELDRFAALNAQLEATRLRTASTHPPDVYGYSHDPSQEALLRLEVFHGFIVEAAMRNPADQCVDRARQVADLVVIEARRLGVLPADEQPPPAPGGIVGPADA